MPNQSTNTTGPADEINLKELIARIRSFSRYLIRFWPAVLVLTLLGAALGFYWARRQPPTYNSEVTFVVEDGKNSEGGLNAYAGLASQFGVNLGGGGGSNLYQGANLIELLKSRLMIQRVLMSPYPKDSSSSIADVYFRMLGLKESWDKNDRTRGVQFPLGTDHFTPMQDSAMGLMYGNLIDDRFLKIESSKKSSILKISYVATSEYFAWIFVNRLVQEATDFYVQTKTKRSLTQVNNLQRMADSLLYILNRKSYNAAASQNINLNPALRTATVGAELAGFDKGLTQSAYSEVFRNLQVARAALIQDMPIIQIIDKSTLPLTIQKKSKAKYAIIFALAAFVLTLAALIIRKVYNDSVLDN